MIRLRFCALAIFVTTSSAAMAVGEDGQTVPNAGATTTELATEINAIDHTEGTGARLALGAAKASAPCPTLCILRRISDPRFATVGEREVVAFMLKTTLPQGRLHVDSRRSAALQTGKIPRAAIVPQAAVVPTRNQFRPAFDPVLAEPATGIEE